MSSMDRAKDKAYLKKYMKINNYETHYCVKNWKHELMGDIIFNSDLEVWCFYPCMDTSFGPEFLSSLAKQMVDIQEADKSTRSSNRSMAYRTGVETRGYN